MVIFSKQNFPGWLTSLVMIVSCMSISKVWI